MCECLPYSDGTLHLCEACAGDLAHYKAKCEKLEKRNRVLHDRLRSILIRPIPANMLMFCDGCCEGWGYNKPESHALGCLCAPEAGPEIDASKEEKSNA